MTYKFSTDIEFSLDIPNGILRIKEKEDTLNFLRIKYKEIIGYNLKERTTKCIVSGTITKKISLIVQFKNFKVIISKFHYKKSQSIFYTPDTNDTFILFKNFLSILYHEHVITEFNKQYENRT